MVDETMALLAQALMPGRPAWFVDATFGAGGHAKAILAHIPWSRVVAIDADPAAVARAGELAAQFPSRLKPVHANFAQLEPALAKLGTGQVDGVIYDLGLSSLQLADPRRGFSFALDAPLDLRFDPSSDDPSAAQLLAEFSERELSDILFRLGDERHARRIARSVAQRRRRSPLETTSDLVGAVLRALPAGRRRQRIHPATRTFLALRIAVNRELERLESSLTQALARTRRGGRIIVIGFHSGEDRTVKQTFARWRRAGSVNVLTPKPLRPQRSEVTANPRSRSAKLRAVEKLGE